MASGTGLVALQFTEPERRPQPQKQSSGYFDEHFERLRPFGQGAFGEVWCCKDHLDREPCAVKAVRYKGGTGVEMSVIREAQILAGMDHPNIVRCDHAWIQTDTVDGDTTAGSTRASSWPSTPMTPFALAPHFHRDAPNSEPPHLKLTEGVATETLNFTYDATESDLICFEMQDEEGVFSSPPDPQTGRDARPKGEAAEAETNGSHYSATLFLQMELCKDKTLQHWIAEYNADHANQKRFEEAKKILVQCLRALAYLHSHNCVHRDVKPSNLLFGQDEALRLADFGLAKWLEFSAASPRLPARGMNGTPCYASPEQLAGKPVETSTDLYSLGVVLAELICPVHTQMERTKVLEGLKERRTLPVKTFLADLAVRMTEVEPGRRPSALELLMELGEEVSGFPDPENCAQDMASRATARFTVRHDAQAEDASIKTNALANCTHSMVSH